MIQTFPLSKTQRARLAEATQRIAIAQQAALDLMGHYLAQYDVVDGDVTLTDDGIVVTTPDAPQDTVVAD